MGVGLFVGLFVFEVLNLIGVLETRVDYTWRGRVISTAFVFAVMGGFEAAMRRWVGRALSGWVWLAAILLILVDFMGDVFHLYLGFAWYDRFAHGFSGVLVAGGLFRFFGDLATGLGWRVPTGVVALLAFGAHEAFSVLYELEEHLEDVFFGSQRSGGAADTADDLLLSFVYGAVTVTVLALFERRQARRTGIASSPPSP